MSSVLDIDLDYFNLTDNPLEHFERLLEWAACPIMFVADNHHHVLGRWKKLVKRGTLASLDYILHIDEHHDMMDEKLTPNIANFIYHAMRTWPKCHVHWLVDNPIDSPSMWISDEMWDDMSERFTSGSEIPSGWPKPQFATVATSPEFVEPELRRELLGYVYRRIDAKSA
jgi:hypothetical protein